MEDSIMNNTTHSDHRERLRTRFLNAPESFEDHEILELILFYAIPRVNTNETAHNLIERFGSLKGVLDAEYTALMGVDGMGKSSALYMRAISELLIRYERSNIDKRALLNTPEVLHAYLRSLFVGTEREMTYLILLDNSMRLLRCDKVGDGYSVSNDIVVRNIISLALNNNAAGAILVHNHPNGKAIPSGEDIMITNHLEWLMRQMSITLIQHFIIAENKCVPILSKDSHK
jgi:DNA repair protein RadC